MLTLRSRGRGRPDSGVAPRRLRATALSVGVHLLLAAGLWQALQFPRVIDFLNPRGPANPLPERLQFLTVSSRSVASGIRTAEQPQNGETAPPRPVSPPEAAKPSPPSAPLSAPPQVPTSLPPAGGPVRIEGPTSGPLVGGLGAVRGVQPGYTEPRIWIESPAVSAPALEGEAKLDSAVTAFITAYRDSVAANTYQPNKYERGDWTYTTKDGKKYGIDQRFIRLGKVSIPTALLGLLPMNQIQGNPIAYERQKRLDAMRVEIIAQAQQAMNEEEFRHAVKQIRERKDRERKELEKKKKKEAVKVIS